MIRKNPVKFQYLTLVFCTNLVHQNLSRVLHKRIEFSFRGGCKNQNRYRNYLTVIGAECVWTKFKLRSNNYRIIKLELTFSDAFPKSKQVTLTKQIKKAIKRHPTDFKLFSVSSERTYYIINELG